MKTVLCVPGHDEKKVRKCREYGADLILFDLEDSVPEGMKERAREIVAVNITETDAVRVNRNTNADIPRHGASLDSVRPPIDLVKASAVWIPKLTRWEDLARYDCRSVVIIIETPQLMYKLSQLKGPRPLGPYRLAGLAFGAADFAAYMNVPQSSPQVDYARQQVALAAAALGVPAYDSPCTNVRGRIDAPDSAYNEAYRAAILGYQWKGVVHPSQIYAVRAGGRLNSGDRQLVDQYEQQSEAVMLTAGGDLIAPPMIRAAKKRLEDAQ